jgi:hypothetical protein
VFGLPGPSFDAGVALDFAGLAATFDCQLRKFKTERTGCETTGARNLAEEFASWNEEALMTENVNVQYVGFEAKALEREYTFIVRRALAETSEYTLAIGNEAFGARRVRFQDAPEICSLRLHHELAAFGNHPPQAHYRISETDLEEYRTAHAPKAWGYPYKPKASREQ